MTPVERLARAKADKHMSKKMKVELKDEAVNALGRMASATGRTSLEVISDALKIYSWILDQQLHGRTIVAEGGNLDRVELQSFLARRSAA